MARSLIEGTQGADELEGTAARELIIGLEGKDKLEGKAGSDKLEGGDGADTLDGGAGGDILRGGKGADTLKISAGEDDLAGGLGSDWLDASGWGDTIHWNLNSFDATDFSFGVRVPALTLLLGDSNGVGDLQPQTVTGIENYKGSSSRDFITSLANFETVLLGAGDDNFTARSVTVAKGGAGDDRISITEGRVLGGGGDDVLSGGRSTSGDRAVLLGGKGSDTLIIGAGEARGGKGADTLMVTGFSDALYGGPGADIFEFNSSSSGQGDMQDFRPGVDKIDISAYTGISGEGWNDLQSMFQETAAGVELVLDLQRFKNQDFLFVGLTRADLSESDFILV